MLYSIFRALFKFLLQIFYRIEFRGVENIPHQGAVILCSNHISNLDPIVMGIGVMHRKVHYMAKEELFRIPVVSFFVRKFGAFPVKRGLNDRQALKLALQTLRNQHVLGIFPEGTRSKTGKLGKGHVGAAMFAMRTDAVVIPVAIIGPYRLFGRLKCIYGAPLDLSEYKDGEATRDRAREATDEIMAAIGRLIEQHG